MSGVNVSELLGRARSGDQAAWNELLLRFRSYFRGVAQDELDSRLMRRVDASDVVQESFLEAHRDFTQFQGQAEAEWIGWMRRVVLNNVVQQARHHRGAQKRSIDRERFADESGDAGRNLASVFASNDTTIGRRVIRNEESEGLVRALDALLLDQREAVRLHYLEGWSVKEIAKYLGRSDEAVGGLIKRGLRKLRELLVRGENG